MSKITANKAMNYNDLSHCIKKLHETGLPLRSADIIDTPGGVSPYDFFNNLGHPHLLAELDVNNHTVIQLRWSGPNDLPIANQNAIHVLTREEERELVREQQDKNTWGKTDNQSLRINADLKEQLIRCRIYSSQGRYEETSRLQDNLQKVMGKLAVELNVEGKEKTCEQWGTVERKLAYIVGYHECRIEKRARGAEIVYSHNLDKRRIVERYSGDLMDLYRQQNILRREEFGENLREYALYKGSAFDNEFAIKGAEVSQSPEQLDVVNHRTRCLAHALIDDWQTRQNYIHFTAALGNCIDPELGTPFRVQLLNLYHVLDAISQNRFCRDIVAQSKVFDHQVSAREVLWRAIGVKSSKPDIDMLVPVISRCHHSGLVFLSRGIKSCLDQEIREVAYECANKRFLIQTDEYLYHYNNADSCSQNAASALLQRDIPNIYTEYTNKLGELVRNEDYGELKNNLLRAVHDSMKSNPFGLYNNELGKSLKDVLGSKFDYCFVDHQIASKPDRQFLIPFDCPELAGLSKASKQAPVFEKTTRISSQDVKK